MFKWIKSLFMKEENEPKHTCGSWPDPYWTHRDWQLKKEAQKDCPVCNKSLI